MTLSVIIPVYNSELTLEPLVARLQHCLHGIAFEVILVNDGSRDGSEAVCEMLARLHTNVLFISLRRNFGEFNAVLCGLNYVQGEYAVIIDDDFQNPPEAILTLLHAAQTSGYDVVYSRYADKKHAPARNLGSWLVNRLTTPLLGKPADLYLSSFKLIRREVVTEICKYTGPYPYIDGLIFRVTQQVGSVLVPHQPRQRGQSNYTAKKLVSLFLNVLIGYSVWPLRVFTLAGFGLFMLAVLLGIGLVIAHVASWFAVPGWVVVGVIVLWLAGLQMLFLGLISEYLGKVFMSQSGLPPYVIKTDTRSSR